MAEKEFLDARALAESVRLFGRLTEDGQSLVDNLTQAGLAAPEVLAAAGIDSRFIADAALPRNPTPAELAALPAGATLSGLYRPDGRVQRLTWDAGEGAWRPAGDPLPGLTDVQEARAVADSASFAATVAETFASTTTDNPRNPTPAELARWEALAPGTPLPGSRLTADGWRQRLTWRSGAWQAEGPATLDTDLLADIAQSANEALALTGINPAYISETTANPGAAPDGTRGAKRTETGGIVRLERVAGAWVARGEALPGQEEVRAVRAALGNLALADLADRSQDDGPQLVDGSRWVWRVASSLPTGGADGGTVVEAADGGYWHREFPGAVYPEMWGAVGDGVADDTAALQAALDHGGAVRLRAGRTYRIITQLIVNKLVDVQGEGALFVQFNRESWQHDAAGAARRWTRILCDFPASIDANHCAYISNSPGSRIDNVEFVFPHQPPCPPKTSDTNWTPRESGWAVRLATGWQTATRILVRGFRRGLHGPQAGGCNIADIWLNVYDVGLDVDNATDVLRLRRIHQTIMHTDDVWDSWGQIEYMLNHLVMLRTGRMDNPSVVDVFGIACRVGWQVVGQANKVKADHIEWDESKYGIVVEAGGRLDALIGSVVWQRWPEGESGYGTISSDGNDGVGILAGGTSNIYVSQMHARGGYGSTVVASGNASVRIGQLGDHPAAGNTVPALVANDQAVVEVAQTDPMPVNRLLYAVNGNGRVLGSRVVLTGIAGRTLAPGTEEEVTVEILGLTNRASCGATMQEGFLPVGVVVQTTAARNAVRVRFANLGAAPATIPSAGWVIRAQEPV